MQLHSGSFIGCEECNQATGLTKDSKTQCQAVSFEAPELSGRLLVVKRLGKCTR